MHSRIPSSGVFGAMGIDTRTGCLFLEHYCIFRPWVGIREIKRGLIPAAIFSHRKES